MGFHFLKFEQKAMLYTKNKNSKFDHVLVLNKVWHKQQNIIFMTKQGLVKYF